MTVPSWTIERLLEADAAAVAALESAFFSTPWTAEQYAGFLSALPEPDREDWGWLGVSVPVLGVRCAGALAAYLCLGVHHAAAEMEIYSIAVREELRQNGLGRALLARALELGAARGIEQVFLDVRSGNAPALALYASLGFSVCGRRPRYYRDTGEDALVMRRSLGPADVSGCSRPGSLPR